jgi:tetratricopeptide (TPR) repeat protein
MVYLNQKRIPEAKDRFATLVAADKDDGYAHLGLGMALAAEQNYQAAIEEYKVAAHLEPDLESVFYRMGVAQAKQKDYDAAIAAFRTQQQKAGDDIDTENALAEAYRANGMEKEAEEAMRRAQQLNPSK